jgi:hypothetical protein
MAAIKIHNLSVPSSELLSDYESSLQQLTELSELDAMSIKGGWSITITITIRF